MTVKAQKARVLVEDKNVDSSDSEVESQHSDSEQIDDESMQLLNEGWADSIAKILRTNKPKKKKSLVLSKAKKLTDPVVKRKKVGEFEVQTAEGEIKKEEVIVEEKVELEGPQKKKKRELPKLRVKPDILEKDRERTLQKIATKGVVQLFNAVKMQQKDISKKLDEAGPLEVRKEKVLKNIDKRAFLDVLMGEKSSNVDEEVKKKPEKQGESWNVLRDDFLMSAKMKDWDKEVENEEESEKEMEVEEDVESE
ncbi:RRP15-like protein [Anthonomus grandis grandis]|uniref:RRP15-like protein n=1 Tax=Anthonomus grandis grandis TaxID=2921223 RepID=UPI0021655F10|nr:RRP15-like protein [Anthonomus grandis grandis]